MMWVGRRVSTAPRLAMAIHLGRMIESGVDVCHACDNPNCVNPEHLWVGSHRANMLDSHVKGRMHYSQQTHCQNGHPLSGENLYLNPAGARVCKACRRAYHRARYKRLTEHRS